MNNLPVWRSASNVEQVMMLSQSKCCNEVELHCSDKVVLLCRTDEMSVIRLLGIS